MPIIFKKENGFKENVRIIGNEDLEGNRDYSIFLEVRRCKTLKEAKQEAKKFLSWNKES